MRLVALCVLFVLLLMCAPVCALSSEDASSPIKETQIGQADDESGSLNDTSQAVPLKKGLIRRLAEIQAPEKTNSGSAETDQNSTGSADPETPPQTPVLSTLPNAGSPILLVLALFISISAVVVGMLYLMGKQLSQRLEDTIGAGRKAILSGGYLIIACGFLALSLLLLSTFQKADIKGIFFSMAGGTSGLFLYLALSSAVMLYSLRVSKPFLLIHLFHPVITMIAGVLYVLILIMVPRIRVLIPAWASVIIILISLAISVTHYRLLSEKTLKNPDFEAGAVTDMALADTVLDGQTKSRDAQYHFQEAYFPRGLEDKYTQIEYVGKGGIARVFKATRRQDGNIVAVKVPINFDETTGKLFLKEMQIWKDLHHPNIIELYEVNILPVPYVEMEYVTTSLAEMSKPMPIERTLHIITGIANGLAYAHAMGIIHRDIKPHNILVSTEGTPMITDWGLGKLMSDTHETKIMGFSLSYAAPEQINPKKFGKTDVWTDIYQLGAVFYELLTGRVPCQGEGLGEMSEVIVQQVPSPPSTYRQEAVRYDAVVMKCLQKIPKDRYFSVHAMLDDLKNIR
jgi:hypothetical protein